MTIRTAVVLTTYRQAAYLGDAVSSALAQGPDVGVVAVNDGCPQRETHDILRRFQCAFPDRFQYLRTANSGQSAAINTGVRHLRVVWPDADRVFFLDADNWLKPGLLRRLGRVLDDHPEASWVYPNLERFGTEEGVLPLPSPFSRFRQIWENQSDNGSLVRREVLADHERLDDIVSWNDWAFFLSLSLAGHRGVPGGTAGLGYRKHGWSMLSYSRSRADQLRTAVWSALPRSASPHLRLALEHEDQPRFGIFGLDGAGWWCTDPSRPRVAADLPRTLRHEASDGLVPPAVLVVAGDAWEDVPGPARPGLLLRMQAALAVAPMVGARLRCDDGDGDGGSPCDVPDRAGATAHVWALRLDSVAALVAPRSAPAMAMIDVAEVDSNRAVVTADEVIGLLRQAVEGAAVAPPHESARWCLWQQVEGGDTLLPVLGGTAPRPVHVVVAADAQTWSALGPDIAELAAADGVVVHVLLTDDVPSPGSTSGVPAVASVTAAPESTPCSGVVRRAVLARADVALLCTPDVVDDVEQVLAGSAPRLRIVASRATLRAATALVRRLEQVAPVVILDEPSTGALLAAVGLAPSEVTTVGTLADAVRDALHPESMARVPEREDQP